MPISACVPNSTKLEDLQLLCPAGHTYKIALYDAAAATLDKTTNVYTAVGEVVGDGYVAGGKVLTNYSAALVNDAAVLDFDDAIWDPSTISADGALLYDATDGNKVRAVVSFGGKITSTNGPFKVVVSGAIQLS